MDKEREELAKKIEKTLRPRIERVIGGIEEFKKQEVEGLVGTEAYMLLSDYLLFHSSEKLNALTRRLNWVTIILIVLTALTIIAAFKDLFYR